MRIVQVVPEVTVGSGVEAVAHHLEREWQRMGVPTERFTLPEARGAWLPLPGPGIRGRLQLASRVVWFSTVGTILARRRWGRRPADTIVICHNDVLFGDVYVNHGILPVAMDARGHKALRMVRNPLHLFTWARDAIRFASPIHRVVVNLTEQEATLLSQTYPRVRPRRVVIGNGVDVDRYQPPTRPRAEIRAELGLPAEATYGVFVGHEYSRKGLPQSVEALLRLPADVQLIVVGGTSDLIEGARRHVDQLGLTARVHFVGRQGDVRPWLQAADFLVFPSKYEAYSLVVLEAMATGLPVVSTPVGAAPEVVVDGVNGEIVDDTSDSVAAGITRLLGADLPAMRAAARMTAEGRSWARVARQYLDLFEKLLAERP